MRDFFRTLHLHAAYASLVLGCLFALFEYALPGSVLPYFPLFPLVTVGTILLVTVPETEGSHIGARIFAGLVVALMFLWLVMKLKDGGKSDLVLLVSAFALLLATWIISIKKSHS